MLKEFLSWFKGRKKRTMMMDMVEQSGPKSAGKKPSTRKRTNAKSKPIERYVDLLGNNEEDRTHLVPATTQQSCVPAQMTTSSFPSSQLQPSSFLPSVPSTVGSYRAPEWFAGLSSQMPYPSMATYPAMPAHFLSRSVTQVPQTMQFNSTAPFQYSSIGSSAGANQPIPMINQPNRLPASAFQLKWLQGTKVSRCYGCGGAIQNPPQQCPDDLVVVCRDIREYRDRLTGQLMRNSEVQNVHFRFRRECLLMRYPTFHVGLLQISPVFYASLSKNT